MKKTLLTLSVTASISLSAQSPILIEGNDSSLKVGFLSQVGFEAIGSDRLEGTSQNLFFRRLRLIFAGNFGSNLEYYITTDNPNLGKGSLPDGSRNNSGLLIQDAILIYKFTNKINLDVGFMPVPLSHIGTQGATTLHTWDYPSNALAQNGPIGGSSGRDAGAMVRGVVGKKHGNLEFRVGVFQ
ncbi:MAG: OprO/OprP family phosphate-selective porin, partial [Holophagales bacterium]|nr:OprO/OprP family phosphate-selective porin [Holophagales bacterium]